MVLVESLSLGIPAVSLDIVSGPSEIIKHEQNGLLIAKRNVSLFAKGMQRMSLDGVLRDKCKQNAKASVAQFSTDEIAKQWNQLVYNELR